MQVNVNATFMLTQALLPLLLKSDAGSLVFTSIKRWTSGDEPTGVHMRRRNLPPKDDGNTDEYQQRLRVNCD